MAEQAQEITSGAEGVTRQAAGDGRRDEDEVPELQREEEHPGGGRFNRLLLFVIAAIAIIVGVVAAQGIRSAGVPSQGAGTQPADDGADAAGRRKRSARAGCHSGAAAGGNVAESPDAG